MHEPPILFLDEPTTGLDVHAARALRETLIDLHRSGLTLFLTTHQIAEAERLADRVAATLVKGRVVAVAALLPLTYTVDGLRHLVLGGGGSYFPLWLDLVAIAAFAVLLYAACYRLVQRRLEELL